MFHFTSQGKELSEFVSHLAVPVSTGFEDRGENGQEQSQAGHMCDEMSFPGVFQSVSKAVMMANVKNAKVKMEDRKCHGIAVWCLPHNNAASFGTENYTFTGWTG